MFSVASDVVYWLLSATMIRLATGKRDVRLQPAAQFALTAVLFDYITRAGYRVFIHTYMLFFAGHLLLHVSVNYVRRVCRWLTGLNEESEENEENEENGESSSDDAPGDYVVRRRRRSPSPRIVRRKSRRLEEKSL